MSISVMSKVWNSQTDFSPSELLVLLALADWANDEGFCWPAVPTLARKARMKDRNAQLILKKLERGCFIEILPHRGPKGANMYRVLVHNLHRVKRPRVVQNPEPVGAKPDTAGVQNSAEGGVKGDVQGVHPITPNPSLDTSGESSEKTPHTTQTGLRAVGAPAAERVCVSENQFSLKTFERYARNQPGIHNPVGWAGKHHKSGEWDEQVARWCAEHAIDPRTGDPVGSPGEHSTLAAPTPVDASACPDCRGTLMYYPAGFGKGVARCKHPQLAQRGAA